MKKKFLILLGLSILLVGCDPITQSQAVQLPDALIALIGMALLVGLTTAAKWILDRFGFDIKDRAAEIAASLSAVVVLIINYLLGLVPVAYDGWLNALFAFLVVLFGGIGIFSLVLRKKSR
jgi:hypothetical protein